MHLVQRFVPFEYTGYEIPSAIAIPWERTLFLILILFEYIGVRYAEPPSEQVATCLRRPLRNGAHGGTTMASRSTPDAKNLGLDGSKPEVLGRGRVRKAPQVFEAGAAVCFTRQKISDVWQF